MATQALISKLGSMVYSSIGQVETNQEFQWKGRKILYRISGALIGTGLVAGVISFVGFYVPTQLPSSMLGIFSTGVVVVTCIGGCCLWRKIPSRDYEDAVIECRKSNEALNQRINVLNANLADVKQERVLVIEKLNKSYEDFNQYKIGLVVNTNQLQTTKEEFQVVVEQANQVNENFAMENKTLRENLARVTETLNVNREDESLLTEVNKTHETAEFLSEYKKKLSGLKQ